MTFRLTTLLYLFALVASSAAVFGPWGLLVGAYVFALWLGMNRAPGKYRTWPGVLELLFAFVLIPGILVALLVPAVQHGAIPGRDATSDLRALSLAILNYHEIHDRLPPPWGADEAGVPLYSWRAIVFALLEGNRMLAVQRDEPWDSNANRKLLLDFDEFQNWGTTPSIAGETHYFAVVGPGTVWDPEASAVTLDDITDGLDSTILLISAPNRGIRWSEPRELSLDEAIKLLSDDATKIEIEPGYLVSQHFEVPAGDGHYVAMADGSVHWLPPGIDPKDARALCTRAGGEPLKPLDDPYWDSKPSKLVKTEVHWHRITNFVLWIAIILLPFNRRVAIFPTKPT
jgi:hypothetical protein